MGALTDVRKCRSVDPLLCHPRGGAGRPAPLHPWSTVSRESRRFCPRIVKFECKNSARVGQLQSTGYGDGELHREAISEQENSSWQRTMVGRRDPRSARCAFVCLGPARHAIEGRLPGILSGGVRFDNLQPEGHDPSDLYVLHRKVDDAGSVVLDSMSSEEEKALDENDHLYEDDLRNNDDKLSTINFELKSTKERISTFHSDSEDREKKPEEGMHGLFSPLTHEEASYVFGAMQGGNSCEVLVKHEASSIEITREVFQCLNYRAWLNEEVINVYLELLKEREKREPERFLKCHFFNTFFYKKLFSGTNCYDFKGVRRWTTQKKLGYGLIECDKIFVPVHKDLHWSLAVINVKEESFQYLDSLGAMDNTVLTILAMYFMDEVKDKSDKQINTLSWKQEAVKDLPLQGNVWDCGMFMLKYADFYSRGLSLCFSQDDMPYFRRRTAKEILSLRAE